MIINDELKIYRGDDFYVSDNIYVRQPTINEICDFGEEKYLRMVSRLVSVPQNSIYMLTQIGIDFTKISDFELFLLIYNVFDCSETSFIVPNLNFATANATMINKVTSKGTVLDKKEIALQFENGTMLKEKDYLKMMSYIRKINRFQRPWFKTVGNESTKKRMIQSAINEYEKQMCDNKPFQSIFLPMVSSLSLAGYRDSVWDMRLFEFYETVERLQIKENSNHLYNGIYSGSVDYKKVKGNLNWMKKIEFSEYDKKINMLEED